MTKTRHLFAGLAVALASWLTAGSAYAQNTHSWVSASTGTGTACTRAVPCSSFANAQTATLPGGVISVLDPGDNNGINDGIIATTPSGGAPIGVMVTNSKSVNNNFGIRSLGPGVTVRVGDSTITGNGTGLAFSGGGSLLTYGTNKVQANGADAAFSGPIGLQ
jgi:hypothetical protein